MAGIGFDEFHKEAGVISDPGPSGLSLLAAHLTQAGHSVFPLTQSLDTCIGGAETATTPDIVVIPFPRLPLSKEEITAFKAHISGGRHAMVLAEWGNLFQHVEQLNEVTTTFGVELQKDRVTDLVDNFTQDVELGGVVLDTKSTPQFVRIRTFADHPVTEGISELIYFAGCSIKTTGDALILASCQESGFGDLDHNIELDPGEQQGQLPVAVVAEDNGRLLVIGDSNLIANGYMKHADNTRFVHQSFEWLAGSR